tara:strand:- start:22839 stop:23027 length:189 start_codon:yes stop_codon:yes gene_type:complete
LIDPNFKPKTEFVKAADMYMTTCQCVGCGDPNGGFYHVKPKPSAVKIARVLCAACRIEKASN